MSIRTPHSPKSVTSNRNPHELRKLSIAHHLARRVWVTFIVTFVLSRAVVLLDTGVHLELGGTHIHHLIYGIMMLAATCGYLLFVRPEGRALGSAAIAYGIGLALTFDEFGMWLHLEDDYWHRASFDAVGIIAGLLGLIVAGPTLRRFRPRHWATAAGIAFAVALFGALLLRPLWHPG
jgi:hypothetical protein